MVKSPTESLPHGAQSVKAQEADLNSSGGPEILGIYLQKSLKISYHQVILTVRHGKSLINGGF
jgi:hypothetical protein